MLTDYFDRERTTIQILRDYRDQEWKRTQNEKRVAEIDDRLTAVSQQLGSAPVSGGENKTQETWCSAFDEKTVAETGLLKAAEFFQGLEPCLNRLTPDERALIELRWIDSEEQNGIKTIMERYHIEKTEAYKRSNAALSRLAKLLFW